MREGEFRLRPSERRELRDRLRSRTLPAEDVRRARLVLLLAQGKSYLAIRQVLGCNPNYISRWKGRFEAERLAGLYSHHRTRGGATNSGAGGQDSGVDPQTRAGWCHALEQPQTGPTLGYQPHDGGAGVAARRA
jgi:Homeodomain-like domain-containing protein